MRSAVIGLATVAALGIGGRPVRAELKKGPYLQNVTPTGITVMWQAEPPAAGRVTVQGPGLPPDGRTIDVAAGRMGETVIDGLRPATRYRYRVDVGGATDKGEFATAPELGSSAPFSFVVFGDNGRAGEGHHRVIERAMTDVPDFILGTGDAVYHGGNPDEWQALFDVERPLLRDNPIYPTVGNHDRQGPNHTIDNYRALFSLPTNSPHPEQYYAFTYGNARFIVLDSNTGSFALTDETAWLEGQLVDARQDPRIHHVFVTMHHPPYSIATHGGQRNLRERWTPLFEKYGVAAVFSGHDHVYERAEANGVRYFVSGGGGAGTYKVGKRASPIDLAAVQKFERVNHYLRVTIQGDQIEVTAVRTDGTPIETTTWGEPRPPSPTLTTATAGELAAPPAVAAHAGSVPSGGSGLALLGVAGAAAAILAAILFAVAMRRRA